MILTSRVVIDHSTVITILTRQRSDRRRSKYLEKLIRQLIIGISVEKIIKQRVFFLIYTFLYLNPILLFSYTAEANTEEYISVLKIFLYVQDSETKIGLLFDCFSGDLTSSLVKSLRKAGITDPILTMKLSHILGRTFRIFI